MSFRPLKRRRLVRGAGLACVVSLWAAPLVAQPAARLDPRLQRRLHEQAARPAAPTRVAGQRPAAGADPEERLDVVVHTANVPALRAAGFEVGVVFDGLATVRVAPRDLVRLTGVAGVQRVEEGEPERVHNDAAGAFVGAKALHDGLLGHRVYRGAGALVCLIDTGLDFRHLDFRSTADTTKSRVLRLYDLTLSPVSGEQRPSGLASSYTTGVEYTQAQLNDELDGTPRGLVRSKDTDGHGTHLAGTAAGNGGATGQHVGMAPEADLVVVKAGSGMMTTTAVLTGLRYCGDVATATGRPVVVNMSFGSDAGSHDGQDAKGRAVASFVKTPGRVVVQAAGNSGHRPIHRGGSLAPGDSAVLAFDVFGGSASDPGFSLDLWGRGRALAVTVTTPGGRRVAIPSDGDAFVETPEGAVQLSSYLVANTARYDGDDDRQVYVSVFDSYPGLYPAAGRWTVTVRNADTAPDAWDAWLYDATSGGVAVGFPGADTRATAVSVAPEAISAGASVHRWTWLSQAGQQSYGSQSELDRRARFSGLGPSRDGRVLPDLVAPGQAMLSARSAAAAVAPASLTPDGRHMRAEGTSMSAAVVTGSVALLLGANPSLTAAQVKDLLRSAASADAGVTADGPVPNNAFGYGRLDVFQAVAQAVAPAQASDLQVVRYDVSGGAPASAALPMGQSLLLRFEAGSGGRLGSTLFHAGGVLPSGGYRVQVLESVAGQPGAAVTPAAWLAPAQTQAFGWNVMPAPAEAGALAAGQDYFLAITPEGSDGSFMHDGSTATGRTSISTSASLSGVAQAQEAVAASSPYNALVRPVLVSDASTLPVELVLFEGVLDGADARLTWATASERVNAGWHVETRGGGETAWRTLGFVPGAGTTTEARRYGFRATDLAPGRHAFRLRQVDTDGTEALSAVVEVERAAAQRLALDLAGPNPVTAQTAFRLSTATEAPVTVDVFDVLGRRVATLHAADGTPGRLAHVDFDARGLGAGLYVVRAEQAGTRVQRLVTVAR